MKTPPKDRTFLANIGLPWYVVAHWNPIVSEYVYAEFQVDMYLGKWDDAYFQTEYFKESEIIDWIEMPRIEETK